MTGYVWVTAMAVTAISSFWIRDFQVIAEFSPIHLLSVLVLLGLWQAIGAARRGDIATHRRILRQIGVWALGIAGIFTLMPGRLMNEVLFADLPVLGFVAALVTAVILAAIYQFRLVCSGTGRPFR